MGWIASSAEAAIGADGVGDAGGGVAGVPTAAGVAAPSGVVDAGGIAGTAGVAAACGSSARRQLPQNESSASFMKPQLGQGNNLGRASMGLRR